MQMKRLAEEKVFSTSWLLWLRDESLLCFTSTCLSLYQFLRIILVFFSAFLPIALFFFCFQLFGYALSYYSKLFVLTFSWAVNSQRPCLSVRVSI